MGIDFGITKLSTTRHMTFLTTVLYAWRHPHILLEIGSVPYPVPGPYVPGFTVTL